MIRVSLGDLAKKTDYVRTLPIKINGKNLKYVCTLEIKLEGC